MGSLFSHNRGREYNEEKFENLLLPSQEDSNKNATPSNTAWCLATGKNSPLASSTSSFLSFLATSSATEDHEQESGEMMRRYADAQEEVRKGPTSWDLPTKSRATGSRYRVPRDDGRGRNGNNDLGPRYDAANTPGMDDVYLPEVGDGYVPPLNEDEALPFEVNKTLSSTLQRSPTLQGNEFTDTDLAEFRQMYARLSIDFDRV